MMFHHIRLITVILLIQSLKVVEEVMVSVLRAPKHLREDIIEINCHGGILTINRVLELTMTYGARMAEPGEFTKRAF